MEQKFFWFKKRFLTKRVLSQHFFNQQIFWESIFLINLFYGSKNILDTKFNGPKFFWTLIFWTKIFCPLFLLDPKFSNPKILDQFFLVRVEVEQKLKWITSKTFMIDSGPFKTALKLFQSCFKTIKDPQRLLQRWLQDNHT